MVHIYQKIRSLFRLYFCQIGLCWTLEALHSGWHSEHWISYPGLVRIRSRSGPGVIQVWSQSRSWPSTGLVQASSRSGPSPGLVQVWSRSGPGQVLYKSGSGLVRAQIWFFRAWHKRNMTFFCWIVCKTHCNCQSCWWLIFKFSVDSTIVCVSSPGCAGLVFKLLLTVWQIEDHLFI